MIGRLFNNKYAGIFKTCEVVENVISRAIFILLFVYHSKNFQKCSVCVSVVYGV